MDIFSGLGLGVSWAYCGSLGASQNPSALCIKSGGAGASVALMIRSEYLQKEALLLLGCGTRASVAEVPPKKFRLGSLPASSGRRTDPLHIHSGSWPPGPETLSFFQGFGDASESLAKQGSPAFGPSSGHQRIWLGGLFLCEGRLGTFFLGGD